MRKAAAWNLMGVDKATQAAAEEAARRAGMSVADWLDEVVAEQAAGQGVAAQDFDQDLAEEAPPEPAPRAVRNSESASRGRELRVRAREATPSQPTEPVAEPIRERRVEIALHRRPELVERRRAEPSLDERRERPQERQFGRAPERKLQGPPPEEPVDAELEVARDPADDRLEAVIARLEAKASRREQQTAKALETMADWIERSESGRARLDEIETDSNVRDEYEAEPGALRAADPEAPRPSGRARVDLQDAIVRIQRRRGELDARQGLEPAPQRAARREPEVLRREPEVLRREPEVLRREPEVLRREPEVTRHEPDARRGDYEFARREPAPEAEPTPQPKAVAVDALRADIADLNARLERMRQDQRLRAAAKAQVEAESAERRLTPSETEGLRAELAAMRRSLGELAPRNANVALEGAIVDLGQRLDAMRKAPASAEALGPLEDMLRQVIQTLRANDPLSIARNVEADLKTLSARIEELARAAVDPALIEQVRRQTEDIRQMLGNAAESAPIARLERQIEQLADYTERLANHPRPAPELERLVGQFAETRAQIERAMSPAFLRNVELRLENLAARIDEALKRPVPTPDVGPIQELVRRVEGLKSAIERQAAQAPATQKIEAAIADIGRRLERPQSFAAFDPRAVDGLAQRIDSLKGAFERQTALATTGPKLDYALAEIDRKLEGLVTAPGLDAQQIGQLAQRVDTLREAIERQAAQAPATQKIEAAIADIGRRLEGLAAAPALDARQFGQLTQRVDTLKEAIERQAAQAPSAQKIEAAIADIGRRLELPQNSAAFDPRAVDGLTKRIDSLKGAFDRQTALAATGPKLDHALAEIDRKLENLSAAPALDARQFGQLTQRVDTLKEAIERQASSALPSQKIEAAISDIGRRLENLAAAPGVDGRQIGQLSQRVDMLKEALERQASVAPTAQKIEAAVADIVRKLDRPAPTPRIDLRPLEDISRQIESVKAAVSQANPPALAKLEAALAEIDRKLDQAAFETRPFEDLAQQVESLKAAVEQQSEAIAQAATLETHIVDIGRKLDRPQQGLADQMAIKSTLQALSARVDDGFRKIGENAQPQGDPALETELLDEMARSLGEVRAAIERQGDFTESASRLETAIANLASRFEAAPEGVRDDSALQDTLHLLMSRLQDWSHGPESNAAAIQDLAARVDHVRATLQNSSDLPRQLASLASELQGIRAKLDTRDTTMLADRVQTLAQRLDRQETSVADLHGLETLVRELGSRPLQVDTSAIESMIGDLGRRIEQSTGASVGLAPFLAAMGKLEQRFDALDPAPLEHAIRDLGDRLEARGSAGLDDEQLERAASLIADRIGPSNALGGDVELLLKQVMQIHDRLDAIGSGSGSDSNAALEKTVTALVAEFEDTRKLLLDVVEPMTKTQGVADDIADLKTEQANAERRMSTRLNRVQELLEDLSERLRDLEVGPEPESRPAAMTQQPAAANAFALGDIPDRPRGAPAARPAPSSARPMNSASAGRALPIEPGAQNARARAEEASEEAAAKPTDLQAHIAAARRAAMAEMNARREQQATTDARPEPKRAMGGGGPAGALRQAQGVLANRRVPFLIGAVLLVAAATVALSELRGGLPLTRHADNASESPAPAPLASDQKVAPPKVDYAPTGSVEANKAPQAVAAPAASPSPAVPAAAATGPGADMMAALPQGLPDALTAALVKGDPNGETELGLRFVEGRGLARDAKVGARWLELAATQGQPYAEYRVGALYERGVGVTKDPQLARAWYQKAAAAGNARAMHNLAVMNAEDGGSGKPDYAEAAAGFRSAGEYGVRDSQFNLGVLYGRGLGVPQDLALSWMWFSLAAQQGDGDAAKKRDEVGAKMDPKTMADAQKRLADFKVKTPAPLANEAPQPPGGWDGKGISSQAAKPSSPAPSASAPPAKI